LILPTRSSWSRYCFISARSPSSFALWFAQSLAQADVTLTVSNDNVTPQKTATLETVIDPYFHVLDFAALQALRAAQP
jgi:hypothetical protein